MESPGDLSFLLKVARRYWRLILFFVVTGLAAGLALQLLLPPVYIAAARVEIDFSRLVNVNPTEAMFNYRLSDSAIDSQTTIISSDGVLGRVVDALDLTKDPDFAGRAHFWTPALVLLGLMPDPLKRTPGEVREDTIEALRKALKADRLGLSYVIEISVASYEAEKSMKIANALSHAYVADQLDARKEVATGAADWFQNRVKQLQSFVADAQREAVQYRMAHQIMLADGKFIDEQQVRDLSLRMIDAQQRRVMAEARFDRVEAIINSQNAFAGSLSGGLDDEIRNPVIVGLLGQFHDLERSMAENLSRYGSKHEAVLRDQESIKGLQVAVVSEFKRIAEGYRSDAEIARRETTALVDMLNEVSQRSSEAQKARIELTILQGAADSYTALRDNFVAQYSVSTQEQGFPITQTRIASPGSLPYKPSSPTPRKTLAGGLGFGLLLGFLTALGSEILSNRMRKRRQIEVATGHRCIGYIPRLPQGRINAGVDAFRTPPTTQAERFLEESLQSILLTLADQPARGRGLAIGVAACEQDEGATTFSALLSAAAESSGMKVLLIDGDFRRGSLARRFKAAGQEGALDRDGAAFRPGKVPGHHDLWFVDVRSDIGAAPASSPLIGPHVKSLIDQAKAEFDLIIVDLAPLAPFSDARTMAPYVDGYVLVVKWDVTPSDLVSDSMSANPEVARHLLGSVYSQVDLTKVERIEDSVALGASRFAANPPKPLWIDRRVGAQA